MAKKLIATGYRIDRNSNTIYLAGNILHQRLLLITDVTNNRILYNFADEGSGLISITYDQATEETRLVCRQSFSVLGVTNSDTLQVLIEEEAAVFRPDDTFVDPVSKFRVSQPENLIDTDFEYGLQTTKWETLKLVNNIPSFYSKGGAVPISVTSVQTSAGSASVLVTAPNHGLAAGSPFEMTGLTSSTYEGGFIVTSVVDSSRFTYLLSFNSTISQELSTVYTACLPGAFYFGSQISVVDIETNGENPSHLTVTTRYPHGFSINTPFYFLNTVAVYRQDIPSTSFVLDDTVTSIKTTTSTSIGESTQDYRVTSVTPYKWIGKSTVYFDSTNIITKTNAPITSARKIGSGAGFQSTPIAVPVFTTGNNSNFNTFNATTTGVTLATGVITLAAATTMQTGDRVEYHAYGLPLKSTVVSATAKDPLQYLTAARFLGSQEITTNGSGTTGYSSGAMSSQQGIMQGQSGETGTPGQGGYYAGAISTTLTIGNNLYYGTIEAGQSIQVFNGPTAVLPVGSTIANFTVDSLTSTTTITIAFPFPLKTGIATLTNAAFYSNWIDPIQNTIRTDLHGFQTGDRIIYRVLGATKGTYTPVAPDAAGIGGLTSDTGYYVIKVDDNTFKLAATYQDALRGIQIDFTNIGAGTYSGTVGSQSRFLPGIAFVSSSASLYLRKVSSTTVTLHPTESDAVNGTNTITFSTAGVGTAHQIVAGRAKFNTTVAGGQLNTITVADGGYSYDKVSSIVITAYQTQRSLTLPLNSGGTISSGGTNTVYFKSQAGEPTIYPNMLMSGTGFTNATVVTVSSPDSNGIVAVTLNSANSATISNGTVYTFADNSGTAATAVPDIRTNCFAIENHGYNIGDAVFLYNPPANTFPTGITASRGYFVYPIDDNHFTLVSTYPGSGITPVFSAANSGTRVAISTVGTVVSNRKFMLTRSFRATAGGTNNILPLEGLLSQSYGLTVNDAFVVTTTDASTATLANVTFSSDVAAPIDNTKHTIYYARAVTVAGNTSNLTFATSTTGGGAVTAVGAKGGTGEIFVTPVLLIADSDSLYIPNHGFSEDDYVLYTTTLTAIGGLNAQAGSNGYLISKLSSDRVKLKNRSTATILDLTSFGTGTHALSNTKYNPIANTINKTAHGFQPGQAVSYDSAGNPVIDGLSTSTAYYVKQVNNDAFRVSDTALELVISAITKPGFGAAPTAAEITASKTMTVTFTANHGLSVGQKIIIANNQVNTFVNGPWTVATIPASPTVNGQPSSITITVPEFINSAIAISQNSGSMGIAYRFVDINQVTGNDSIITPVLEGATFTTVKSMVNSTVTGGNGIVTNHLVESSASIPVDSKVTALSGSNIKTQTITFKQAAIATTTRASDVTTVVTSTDHGYADQQTVTITGVTDTSFNTGFTPVVATVVDATTFTYPNAGTDGSSTGGAATLALTAAQAAAMAANGINSSTSANVTIAAQSVGANFTTGTVATATQITNVSKTLVANAGLIGQTTLIVPNTTGLAVGMPVAGVGIATTAKIKTIIDSTLIELTVPHTASTTASAYTFFQIQAGQDVTQSSTTASTIASTTATASSTFAVASATGIAAGLYVSGNRSTTTFTANANAGTNTFDIASTSNTYTTNRVETARFQLDSTFASTGVFTSGANKFASFRVFKADVGGDINITDNTITLLDHPFLTGDQIKYVSGGTEPTGLTNNVTYYIIKVDGNTVKLAASPSDATAGTAVDISGLGAGAGHILESDIVWGDNTTGLNVGMHVNVTAGSGTVPQGTIVSEKRTITGTGIRGFAFKLSTGIPATRLGTFATGAGEATFTGVTLKGGVGSSGTTIYTDSTTNLAVGMVPTLVAGATSGAFAVNTVVTSIAVDGKSFTVNNAPTTAIAGAALIAGAGNYATGGGVATKIFCSTTSGLVVGQVINVGTSQIAGATGAFTANTRVASIIDAYSFTVTDAPSTALVASKLRAGVDNSTTTIYVPSVTGYQVGQFLALAGSQGNGTGAFAANTKITAINAGAKPSLTVNTAPTTALVSAAIQAGSQSTSSTVTVPTTVGLNTGMEVTLTGGTGTLVGGTTITAIDPVGLTITLSAAPSVALVGASFSATIANAVTTGVYVYSNQPNFPENCYVTDVTGTTVTINTPHGGVTSGNSVTFSPFQAGTYVSSVASTTVTLSQGHAGILGGTALDFSALPPRTVLGAIPAYVATNWALRFEFPNALAVALGAVTTKPVTFTGVGKNLGTTTRYKTSGTHVFTRSSDADGVYNIESVSKTSELLNGYDKFTVRTGSNIPFNTKSFSNSEIDLANNWIKITNHKFRDGTTLIYRAGSATPLGTSAYLDANGTSQTALVDGATYFAVVVDPNYVRLATSFDNATTTPAVVLDLTSGTNGTQSFDTYSIVGLTRGIGSIIATEDSDIIVGNGTKFLTNFKGGDTLRFFTSANPGAIQNYTVASVKSDTSIKLRSTVPAVNGVTINAITNLTATGTVVSAGSQNGVTVQTVTLSSLTTGITTTASATTASTNLVTVGTTVGMTVNQPIVFYGTFGGIISGTTYYIKTIPSGTTLTLSTVAGGDTLVLTTVTGQSAVALSGSVIAPGYYITGAGIPLGTKIGEVTNISTKTVTLVSTTTGLPSYITAALSTTPVVIQPTFEYFINTNVYVKSSATTQHRPFDGGVGMTTGLTPDSSIIRQTRKYFRYQSGKGMQVSMAINFNPPTDMEELTSSLNVATVRTDLPHGFQPGTVNTIRVTDAEVPTGHNGYNGSFLVSSVTSDYTFNYVYEDTALIGKATDASNVITNVASFSGIAVGKTLLTGTFGSTTVPSNNLITAIDETARTVTLSAAVEGSSAAVDVSSVTRANNVVTLVTADPHGATTGDYISVTGVTASSTLNVGYAQVTVVDETTLQYAQESSDSSGSDGTMTLLQRFTAYRSNGSSVAYGFPKFNLTGWNDAAIRNGLYDNQNGMFWEYDGQQLYAVRRSSVQQVSGKINATYRSSLITGNDTKFTTQLNVGEYIVIRGMSYKVIGVDSDTRMYIQPEYRGSTLSNIIGTKTIDTKTPQSQWSLDACDGMGRSGYILDLNRIQMAYIDYSWYGAGKIRFGFKDQSGRVIYVHEYIHNNRFVEAYMRSGNIPARYEVITQGEPTFSPQLFHWGTSVIMDGRFDDDKAYLFTADSNTITLTNGGSIVAVSRVAGTGATAYGPIKRGDTFFQILTTASASFSAGSTIQVLNDTTNFYLAANTTVKSVNIIPGTLFSTVTLSSRFKNDLSVPTGGASFTVGGGASASSIAALSPVPLVSIRLAPSVDNGLTGGLGFRDIINRMQLTLKSCGVLLTHESEVKLWLNADLSDSNFLNNSSPSLSQLYKHVPGETIKSGIQLFSFRASGGAIINSTTGQRSLVQTSQELGDIANLGNSILGGDEVFPNGPDILTITVSPIDSSTVSGSAPFQASARITWSESQA